MLQLMELMVQRSNKGELLSDDESTENKGELLRDDAITIGDDYTSELRTDNATTNVVSDRPSLNTSNCNTTIGHPQAVKS